METYIKGLPMSYTKPIKISFFGPSGSGKSTASKLSREIFSELLPMYWFKRCDVAEPLHLIQAYIYDKMGSKSSSQDGKLLQFLAKQFEDNLGPKCINKVRDIVHNYQGKVICINADCRNNAYKDLKENGFIFVKIQTKPFIRSERVVERGDMTIADQKKRVESTNKIEADYIISNDGSLSQFKNALEETIKKIIK